MPSFWRPVFVVQQGVATLQTGAVFVVGKTTAGPAPPTYAGVVGPTLFGKHGPAAPVAGAPFAPGARNSGCQFATLFTSYQAPALPA